MLCQPFVALSQEKTSNFEDWNFSLIETGSQQICNLQVMGYTSSREPGPLMVLQWKEGKGSITITYDNIDKDVMTIYNAAGSAFMRLILSSINGIENGQATFVPDFPITEVLLASRQIAFAEQETPAAPYAFIDIPTHFNSLENWNTCVKMGTLQ